MEKQKRVFISSFKVLEILWLCSAQEERIIACVLIIIESLSSNGEPPAILTFTLWLNYGSIYHVIMPQIKI